MRRRFERMSKEELACELERLYDLAPVGYCTIARSGIILTINAAGAALLGATAQKLEGAPFANVAAIEDRRSILDHLTKCRLGRARVKTELKLREPMRILEIISDPISDADGEVVELRTSLVDVSEQMAHAARLRSLAQAGERLAASLDFATIIEEAAELAVPEVADLCMVDVETEGGKIERRAVRFADREKQRTLASSIMESATRPGWQTPQASVIRTAQPLLHAEVSRAAGTRLAYEDRHADALGRAEIGSL
jgi:PAS domain S-box-containing protein